MSNVITQFLIGIGYDYDDKGERAAKAGMEAIRSSTLAIGSALSSAAIGAGVKVDQLAEKSRKLQDQLYRTSTPTTWVQGYGVALTELGGNADDAVSRVTDLENQLAAIQKGDRGFVDALGQAGFDAGDLAQAKDAQDFISRASDQFSRATHTQRLNMASVLHLTDSEFKLWEQGGSYVREHSQQLAEQIGYTEELNQKQYQYSQSWVELNLELDKAGNTISNIMLPGMINLVKEARSFTGAFNTFAGDHPEVTQAATGVAAGASVATAGTLLGRLTKMKAFGPLGIIAGGGVAANEVWDSIMDYSDATYGTDTTAGGNLKSNSPIGKAWDWLMEPSKPSTSSTSPSEYDVPEYLQKPTHGAVYSAYSPSNDYERQNEHLARTLRDTPLKVDNTVNMNARIELDGQKIGEVVDTQIDRHNQQVLPQFDTQVDR